MQMMIPLSKLDHSPTNVRKVKPSEQGFKSLCASIQSKGLLHNLVVVEVDKGYHVVDGNRRLEALRTVMPKSAKVGCIVIPENDEEVGLHANMMREDMHPLDECDVIMALCADGQETYDSVAVRFGQTQKWVEQRIGLAELSDLAKEKMRNGDFGIGVAQALTLGSHEKQDQYLDDRAHYDAATAKRFMTSAKIPITACLFEPTDGQKKEMGVETDLFGDEEFITDRDWFDIFQQNYINDRIDEYKAEGYYDVVLLQDQYYWDAPELKRHKLCYDVDKFDKSELIAVVTYNTMRWSLDTQFMVNYEVEEAQKAQEEAEQAEEPITPMTFSTPQKELVQSYFADAMLREMFDKAHINMVQFFKAMLCHRKMGYGAHHVHRVGSIYADPQNIFIGDIPDGITDYPWEQVIASYKERANAAFEESGIAPLVYCYTLTTKELDELFVACCMQGMGRYDFKTEAMQYFEGLVDLQGWFKPDVTWVNKWKINQIEDVEQWLFGNTKSGSKPQRVEAITEQLQATGRFDPFGTWPQDPNEQS